MYLGRERLGTRKNPVPEFQSVPYDEEDHEKIEDLVARIKEDYPEFNDLQARIWEVISRYRGDAGISAHGVNYLSSCIYDVVKD